MTSDKKKHTRPLVPKEPTEPENEEIITPVREPSSGRDSAEEIREALAEEFTPPDGKTQPDAEHVTIPLKEYAGQLKQIDMFKAMADEFKDGWQRERAEFSNYRKLVERTAGDERQNRTVDIIKKYLVILDDLERALKTRPTEGPAGEWSSGVELVVRKLQNILDCEGVKRIPAENEAFDPMRHEAISHEESPDHKSGQIIEVVQQGYTIGDRVLRPAQVRVAR